MATTLKTDLQTSKLAFFCVTEANDMINVRIGSRDSNFFTSQVLEHGFQITCLCMMSGWYPKIIKIRPRADQRITCLEIRTEFDWLKYYFVSTVGVKLFDLAAAKMCISRRFISGPTSNILDRYSRLYSLTAPMERLLFYNRGCSLRYHCIRAFSELHCHLSKVSVFSNGFFHRTDETAHDEIEHELDFAPGSDNYAYMDELTLDFAFAYLSCMPRPFTAQDIFHPTNMLLPLRNRANLNRPNDPLLPLMKSLVLDPDQEEEEEAEEEEPAGPQWPAAGQTSRHDSAATGPDSEGSGPAAQVASASAGGDTPDPENRGAPLLHDQRDAQGN